MARINIKNTINRTRTKINPYYSMRLSDVIHIQNHATSNFEMISDAFTFGYAQGMKAAKAEMKKEGILL